MFMNLAEICRAHRESLNLSQVEFATLAGISLPNLQNIESGKANPTLKTAEAILAVTGLQLQVIPKPFDWDELAEVGAPLASSTKHTSARRATVAKLFSALREAGMSLALDPTQSDGERKELALHALVLALKIHFPTTYKLAVAHKAIPTNAIPELISGKLIKLYRIAVNQLAEYL